MRALSLLLLLALAAPQAHADVTRGGARSVGFAAPKSSVTWDRGDGSGVFITGSAQTEWRFRLARTSDDQIVSWAPLWQLFHFTVRDDAPRRRVSFESSFRGGTDLVRGGFRAEVMTAFVDLEPTHRWGLVRIGRQLLTNAGQPGLERIDGVRARMTLHRVGVEAFAGVPLRTRLFALTAPEGEDAELVTGWGRDFTWGAALFLAGHKATQLRFGIQDRLRDGALVRRHLTLDASQGIATRVLVRFDFAADLLQGRFSDLHAGVEARPVGPLKLVVEYHHWQPSFDASSLWSVFATDPYDQVQGRVVITPPGGVFQGWVAGGVQAYPKAVTRDNVPRDEVGMASGSVRGGVTVRPVRWMQVDVRERLVVGTGGDKLMVGGSLSLMPLASRLKVTARGDWQRYGFDLQPKLAGDYGSAGVEVAASPVPWVRLRVSGDAIFTPWLSGQYQLSASLEFLLGVHAKRGGSVGEVAWEPALLAAAGASARPQAMPGLGARVGEGTP